MVRVALALIVPLFKLTEAGATAQETCTLPDAEAQESAMAPANPVVELMFRLDTAGWLAAADRLAGEATIVKDGAAGTPTQLVTRV